MRGKRRTADVGAAYNSLGSILAASSRGERSGCLAARLSYGSAGLSLAASQAIFVLIYTSERGTNCGEAERLSLSFVKP